MSLLKEHRLVLMDNPEKIHINDVEYIRADLVPNWRTDMENAPKDGTFVLIYDGSQNEARVCEWEHIGYDYHNRIEKYGWVWGFDTSSGGNYYFTIDNPVKWMPIPK